MLGSLTTLKTVGVIDGITHKNGLLKITVVVEPLLLSVHKLGLLHHLAGEVVQVELQGTQHNLDLDTPAEEPDAAESLTHIQVDKEFADREDVKKSKISAAAVMKGKISKPFNHDGQPYSMVDSKNGPGDTGVTQIEAIHLVPAEEWGDDVFTLEDKDKLPKEQRRPYYRGVAVKHKGTAYVMGDITIFAVKVADDSNSAAA